MKSNLKPENIQNISESYGVDIEDELTSMLSEELAKEIDKNILRGLGVEPDRHRRRKNSIDQLLYNTNKKIGDFRRRFIDKIFK